MRSLLVAILGISLACSAEAVEPVAGDLAVAAASEDAAAAAAAASALRRIGPPGLDALLVEYPSQAFRAQREDEHGAAYRRSDEWRRIAAAFDRVAAARDAYRTVCRSDPDDPCSSTVALYWHTDWEQARAAAAQRHVPVLSLRLLGRLDEELSCANSRFFRTVLYADPDVVRLLSERFVLHWQSVRPAPRITIDFGDGRKLESTITGNSVHYVLAEDGAVLDVIPGLVSPEMFQSLLSEAGARHAQYAEVAPRERAEWLARQWRREALAGGEAIRALDAAAGTGPAADDLPIPRRVDARVAAPIAPAKWMLEAPSLRALDVRSATERLAIGQSPTLPSAARHVRRYLDGSRLSPESRAMMRTKWHDAATFDAAAARFEESIALDTAESIESLRPRILRRLAQAPLEPVDTLNAWVYGQVFLTPDSDPWLGLLSPDAYAALPNNGVGE